MISQPSRHCTVELQALPSRIGQVRRIVSAQLRYWHLDPLIDPAALGVTELLTNVHRHAQPDKLCTVEIELLLDRLTVSVHDHDPRLPEVRDADPLATCGRGLAMVAAVSESWGVRPRRRVGQGRVVHASGRRRRGAAGCPSVRRTTRLADRVPRSVDPRRRAGPNTLPPGRPLPADRAVTPSSAGPRHSYGTATSVAMARSTSRRAARRAGRRPARAPAARPTRATTTSCSGRHREGEGAVARAVGGLDEHPAEEGAEGESARRAERGDQDGLPADHGAQLRPGLSDGPQQTEFAGALVDREGQRVGDAEQCDEHREGEQRVDQGQHHVDAAGRGLRVLVAGLHLGIAVLRPRPSRTAALPSAALTPSLKETATSVSESWVRCGAQASRVMT